jgi:putative PIG3 family NAD(P)H quinone oxidoreductase
VGETVRGWQIGDRVCALLSGGGYAQRVAVPHSHLFRLPDHWSFETAAAFPEVWLTAFVNLFMEAQLQAGEKVLIHAGGSGVGTAAIQLAHAAGATIYTTAGTAAKREACQQLGATLAIDYRKDDFKAHIQTASQGSGVDVILDPVGASYLVKHLKIMAVGGRLVNIGLMGGTEAPLDMGLLLGKSLRLIGSRLRSRSDGEKALIIQTFKDRFWSQLESKRLHPVIDRTFPIADAQSAHAYVRQNRNLGKVVLQVEI